MHSLLEESIKKATADYVDIRFEESQRTTVVYQGKELESIGVSTGRGGIVRAIVNGGWGAVSFQDPEELPHYLNLATAAASLVGKNSTHLAPAPRIRDKVKINIGKDPQKISLEEKKSLMENYNNILLKIPRIQTTSVDYHDVFLTKYFINSEGSYIEQDWCEVVAGVQAIAREGNNVQPAGESFGSTLEGFLAVEGKHSLVEATARRAVALLDATPVTAGRYTVIVDHKLGGVFAHEAFGHISEGDLIYENERLRDMMKLGTRFGAPNLHIVDDATLKGYRGSYVYDDEGVPASETFLIKNGVLVGRLHSRETAAKMKEVITGNARAINYVYRPIVRMSNTYILPGEKSFAEMLEETSQGLYVKGARGGQTNGEMFTFSAEEAFLIEKGKLTGRVRDLTLTGNVFDTLHNIDVIGNDLVIIKGSGGCGKGAQQPLPVSFGSPHLRIQNVLIGGR